PGRPAVKDLCWCQSTAARSTGSRGTPLSKICAGVNPQPLALSLPFRLGCQRSVLVSIHSDDHALPASRRAVKDLCWCQSTAALQAALHTAGCQRSVLVSIHSL